MSSHSISLLVALEGADEGLTRAITSAERSLGQLSTTAKTAGAQAAAGMAEVKAGMSAFGEQITTAKTQLLAFLSINWAAGKVQEIVQVADAWNMMAARLKLATAGQREFAVAQAALFDIAQRMGVPLQETATLYGKLQQAVRMLGGEQKDALSITESISQALRLSGASAMEAQSSLLQFGQALASGVLRGEEFNSVVENSPRLALALADGLNVPIGRLRKLAEEGRLTADVVVNALMSQKDKLAAEYAQLPQTVTQAFERVRNAFGQWINKVDESTGMTKKLAEALTWLATNLDAVMQWLKRIAEAGLAVLAYRLIPALITAWQTAGAAAVTAASATAAAWTTANLSVSAAVASAGVLKTAFGVLGAFFAGWEIGTWLSDKFEFVRKAGIAMVQSLMTGIEGLQYKWEVFKALFTDDTIAQATQRHQTRLAQMNAIFAQMFAEARKGSEAAKGAMTTAATAAEEIAKRLEAVRQGTQEAVGRGIEAVHAALEKLKSRLGEVEQAVSKAQTTVTDSVAKMGAAYAGLTQIVQSHLQQQLAAITTRYQQEETALENSSKSQAAKIKQGTDLLTQAMQQETALRQQATTQTLSLIDQEKTARVTAAQHQAGTEAERAANVKRIENEILTVKRQTLETNATGGLVGSGLAGNSVAAFASGGAVTPAGATFPKMASGTVPGSGNHDSVPRTLDAGSFVLRKAAVRKYGSLLAQIPGLRHFASGGYVLTTEARQAHNKDVAEALATVDLGLKSHFDYFNYLKDTMPTGFAPQDPGTFANEAARRHESLLKEMLGKDTLHANDQAELANIKSYWETSMAQAKLWGEDTLANVPVAPGSVVIEFDTAGEKTAQIRLVRLWDDGTGAILREGFDSTGQSLTQTAGAINYDSGEITLTTRGDGVFYRQTAGSDSSSTSNSSGSSSTGSTGATSAADTSRTYSLVNTIYDSSLQLTGMQSSANRQANTSAQTSTSGEHQSQSTAGSSYQIVPEVLHLAGAIVVRHRDAGTGASTPTPSFWLPILGAGERLLANGVVVTVGSVSYFDRGDGVLYANVNPLTDVAVAAGTVNYTTGECVITSEPAGGIAEGTLVSGSVALSRTRFRDHHVVLRIPGAPINPGSVQIRVTRYDTSATLILAPGLDGRIDHPVAKGSVDYQTGLAYIAFGSVVEWEDLTDSDRRQWWYSPTNYVLADPAASDSPANRRVFVPLEIDASSLRVNAVAVTRIPLSSSVLGIDTVRLPSDGRVPILASGDVVVVQHAERTMLPNPPVPGTVFDVGRVRLASLRLFDASGAVVPESQYASNLDTGMITLAPTLNLAGYPSPWVAEHRVEDMALVSDVQIDGTLTLTRPLTHAYPAHSACVSSAVIIGDLQARAHTVFSQQTWTGEWADTRSGAGVIAQFNDTLYPIGVSNRGAIEERWALIFTNATEFRVVGEAVGQIAVGNTATVTAPTHPATAVPYFSIDPLGWGSGWAAGDVLRFNTAGAGFPVWIVRTVQQGPATQISDAFQLQIRGDIDR